MSISKEHYIGRLVGLREVRTGILIVRGRIADSQDGTQRHREGCLIGFDRAADFILMTIRDTQYFLRMMCGVPTRRDRLYRTR